MKKKTLIKCLLIILAVIASIVIYLCTGNYKAENEAWESIYSSKDVNVSMIEEGYYFDGPYDDKAIIFYPGAKVECEAYACLMKKIAETNADVFLLRMPFNIAFFGSKKADKILDKYEYKEWFLAGHSLGGVVACNYASNNPNNIKAVINLGSYPSNKMPDNLMYYSFYGTEDKIVNQDYYDKSKDNWPKSNKEYLIEGGNHSGFANYGEQKGDGTRTITKEKQQEYVIENLKEILER